MANTTDERVTWMPHPDQNSLMFSKSLVLHRTLARAYGCGQRQFGVFKPDGTGGGWLLHPLKQPIYKQAHHG